MEQIEGNIELRHLPVTVTQNIIKLLDGDDSILSILMGNITKDLTNPKSELRFTSADIDSIRSHSQTLMKSPVLILIDEWSTMGKIRPNLHHFQALLIKCQLFRAADYVAQLMGEAEPERPLDGPAAKVDLKIPGEVEDIVNGMDYPYSDVQANLNKAEYNRTFNVPAMNFGPPSSNVENITIPFIRPPSTIRMASSRLFNNTASKSDLIKFSNSNVFASKPQPSTLNKSEVFMPALSALQETKIESMNHQNSSHEDSNNIPAFSGLIGISGDSTTKEQLPAVLHEEISSESLGNNRSNQQNSEENIIPVFSQLLNNVSSNVNLKHSQNHSSESSTDSETTNN
ncbi:CLUMA_CG002605, isoform A [Clunio marinus]|uniref:CLUMA_CG002605, isoform A n=1 Tax=Clunio marinus TaxID=568069 RepID=A0A1J1HL63_9DIPT|nr:CLUMA_CG002605, isoform A [Clunio marinus]